MADNIAMRAFYIRRFNRHNDNLIILILVLENIRYYFCAIIFLFFLRNYFSIFSKRSL